MNEDWKAREPLTPPDCDLRDFRFMPLELERLRKSKAWLWARRQPEIGFYMLNLWATSWHEVPAASLEDDDDVLADAAMCDPKRWSKVKDKVLHGWVKCADGRLYHSVVAEKAVESWDKKRSQRNRTSAATKARRANIDKRNEERDDTVDEHRDDIQNDHRKVKRDDKRNAERESNVTFTKGEGEGREGTGKGEGRDKEKSFSSSATSSAREPLQRFAALQGIDLEDQKTAQNLTIWVDSGGNLDHLAEAMSRSRARGDGQKPLKFYFAIAIDVKREQETKAALEAKEARIQRIGWLEVYGFPCDEDALKAGRVCGDATREKGWRWIGNASGNGAWKDIFGIGPPPHMPSTLVTEEELDRVPGARRTRDRLREAAAR